MDTSFLPVKSGHLAQELHTIFKEDMEYSYNELKGSGVIPMLIGMPLATLLSCGKLIVHTVKYTQKPSSDFDPCPLNRELVEHAHSEAIVDHYSAILTLREADDRNVDQYSPNKGGKDKKAENIIKLRDYLYKSNFKLNGTILKVINHKLTREKLEKILMGGDIGNKLTTTHITFGNELNTVIKEVLPDKVQLKRKRSTGETYLIAENDDYGFLQEHLRNMYQEPIRVTFDEPK